MTEYKCILQRLAHKFSPLLRTLMGVTVKPTLSTVIAEHGLQGALDALCNGRLM